MKKLSFANLHLLGNNGDDEYLFRDDSYDKVWIKVRDLAFKLNYKCNKEYGVTVSFKMECHKTPKGTLICDTWEYED